MINRLRLNTQELKTLAHVGTCLCWLVSINSRLEAVLLLIHYANRQGWDSAALNVDIRR